MAIAADREKEAFVAGVVQRRKNLLIRCAIAAIAALVLEPLIGSGWALAWALTFLAIQGVEAALMRGVQAGSEVGFWRRAAGCCVIFASGAVYSAMAVLLWTKAGIPGGTVGILILAGGSTNAIINAGGSRLILAATLGPNFLFLAATPHMMSMAGGSRELTLAVATACLVFAGFILSAYSFAQSLARSEREARRLSDRRSAETEAAAADKSAFIAAVGHDLRTPLSAILTGASELHQGAANATERSHAGLILDAGQMMNRLLDDLLDHSRLEAGRMQVEPVVFNLRDLIARACRFWQSQARAKGVRLVVEGGKRLPAWVEADPVRVRQILNNLLSNAVKFTSEGEVRVRLNAWETDDQGCALTLEVADTGEGMDKDQLGRLFQAFDQTRSGVSRRHGGSGLGLWISRQLAHLMGGRLTVRSKKGEGSAFTLALVLQPAEAPVVAPALPTVVELGAGFTPLPVQPEPEVQADQPEPVAAEAAPEDGEDRPLRVLVVDDHEINRRAVQLILTPLGCDISQAADGMAALAAAETEAFDVIFMDVRMPELDGRETTRRLRASAGPNQHVPVIAVTADTSPADVEACAAAGMTWFVGKPLTPASLLGALQGVLSGESRLEYDETRAA